MDTKLFYKNILNLSEEWEIEEVKVDSSKFTIILYLSHGIGVKFPCSGCQSLCSVYDHNTLRSWRHLDTCQYETYINAKLPRTKCFKCGIKTIIPSWSGKNSRFTEMFECYIIDLLQLIQIQSKTGLALKIETHRVNYIMKKSVERGLSRRKGTSSIYEHLNIDEKSTQKGHNYVTILSNPEEGNVLNVAEGRTKEAVKEVYSCLNEAQKEAVQSVSMDMWSAFESVTKELMPKCDAVHDRFHLSSYLNNAVDITRRAENKRLMASKDDCLQRTKYLWLKNPKTLKEHQIEQLEALIAKSVLKTVEAYQLKEEFKRFFSFNCSIQATNFFNTWHDKVLNTQNAHLIKVATMFKNHWKGLIAYTKHKVSNAIAEGINSLIQQMKAKARGFKSPKAFKTAILFHFGKLSLYP